MRDAREIVRASADIVRIVSDYVSLRGGGKNLTGLCPFHSEKTPSFSVSPDKQIFHCFGCGQGGDVFEFIKLIEQVTFPESIRIVAEKCGIPLPRMSGHDTEAARERETLAGLYERAAAYYQRRLGAPDASAAREVLAAREIRPEFVERFGLGYAPPTGLLAELRPSDPVATGLFSENEGGQPYDRFRRRLMFPIWNERGKVIAFGGRILGDGQPKYLNSPESPLYSKSGVLYGLHLARNAARQSGRMVVVEGYFDCLSLHQNGIENVVASCGTGLTSRQVGLLARSVSEVVVNYDPDSAGQNAARRSIELLLERGLTVRILKLPGGLDPDDFVRKEGADAYRRLLEGAPYFWEHLIEAARSGEDLSRPEVKSRVSGEILDYARRVGDRVVRLEICRRVAEAFRLPEDLVFERLRGGPGPGKPNLGTPRDLSPVPPTRKLTSAEKQVILALQQQPEIAEILGRFTRIETDFLRDAWSGPVIRRLIEDPRQSLEDVLEAAGDPSLSRAVREATLEPVEISARTALSSMGHIYQECLDKEEAALRQELGQYRTGPAPEDLLRRQIEIVTEKSRLRAMHAPQSAGT
jgi:DNA primase